MDCVDLIFFSFNKVIKYNIFFLEIEEKIGSIY